MVRFTGLFVCHQTIMLTLYGKCGVLNAERITLLDLGTTKWKLLARLDISLTLELLTIAPSDAILYV